MIVTEIWSSKALKSYDQVLAYLTSEWGNTSVQKFMDEVERVILLISKILQCSDVHLDIIL